MDPTLHRFAGDGAEHQSNEQSILYLQRIQKMTQLIKRLYGYYVDYGNKYIQDFFEMCIYTGR